MSIKSEKDRPDVVAVNNQSKWFLFFMKFGVHNFSKTRTVYLAPGAGMPWGPSVQCAIASRSDPEMSKALLNKYIFVFWQSLQDTSLPLAELQAVVRHIHPDMVVELAHLDAVLPESIEADFPEKYAAIAPLRQSAVLASNQTLRIREIVARCGYIHSGGPVVFVSQWRLADSQTVKDRCRSYLSQRQCSGAEICWYRTSQEKDSAKELKNLLIDDTRYHLGDQPFGQEAARITVAVRGVSPDSTVSLYAYRDHARVSGETRVLYLDYPERDIEDFLVIYQSDAKNENPIHGLDHDEECKPFWAGIFNTPHRLINALLNLADVGVNNEVVDPFSYSGTVAIETAKLGAIAQSFDLSEVRGAQDNFEFFCTSNGKRDLLNVRRILDDDPKYSALLALAESRAKVNALQMPDVAPDDQVERLMEDGAYRDLLRQRAGRISYYLLRRYYMELKRGVKGKDILGSDGIQYAIKQLDKLSAALNRILSLQQHRSDNESLCFVPGNSVTAKHCEDHTHKSSRVFLSYWLNRTTERGFRFAPHDITSGALPIEDGTVDAVVTDPPYGYGDLLDRDQLQRVYTAFFSEALRILKNGGSLVFCALDKVRTGRPTTKLFTTEEVIRMLHDAACKLRIDFAFPSIDPLAEQARGLYFWKSTKALNRSIFAARVYRRQ